MENLDIDNLEKLNQSYLQDRDMILKAIGDVKEFIKNKGLILYGGQALDYSFKIKDGVGIYNDNILPDYDFMSPVNYEDSIELGYILQEKGYSFIESINGIHVTTRRVRVNFLAVADITFIPESVFNTLPFLVFNDLRVIHPNFQRMDLHSSLAFPYEDPPREVILHRVKKDIKRLKLLDQLYPLCADVMKIKGNPITMDIPDDVVVNGYAALALYEGTAIIKDNSITFESHDDMLSCVTKHPIECNDESIMYEPYLDGRPLTIINNNVEYYFIAHRRTTYNIIEGINVVSINQLCLYFLQKYYEMKDDHYLSAYCRAFNYFQQSLNHDVKNDKEYIIPTNIYGGGISMNDRSIRYDYEHMAGLREKVQWRAPSFRYNKEFAPIWDYAPLYYKMSGKKITQDEYRELLEFYKEI